MTGGRPKFTRMVSVNVEVSPLEPTIKDWNRGFELGDFTSWTAVDAVISEADPYEGDYCCNLEDTDSSVTQTLDDPMPVNAVFEFSAWVKRPDGVSHYTLRMIHSDGSTNDVSGSLVTAGWRRVYFERGYMKTGKILSGIAVLSYEGQVFVDKVTLGLATEVITGAVEVNQATPENLQAELIGRPKGGVLEKGTIDSAAAWATVVEYTVPLDWKFEVAKVLVSAEKAAWIRYKWGAAVISCERLMDDKTILIEHFMWDYKHMRGDAAKTFKVEAKYYEETGKVNAEIAGEYVKWAFNL